MAVHRTYAETLALDESLGLGWGTEHEAKVVANFCRCDHHKDDHWWSGRWCAVCGCPGWRKRVVA